MGILRLLLAISVVICHSTPIFGISIVGGQLAVQAFYIISGFYMTMILNEKYLKKEGSYKLFITNRFLRLYPIYWCVLILTVIWLTGVYFLSPGADSGPVGAISSHFSGMGIGAVLLLIVSNLFLFGQDLVFFLGLDKASGALYFTENFRSSDPSLYSFLFLPQSWTIGLEIMFYLIAPFMVRQKLPVLISIIAASFGLSYACEFMNLPNDPWTYRFLPTQLGFFILGSLSFHIYRKIRNTTIHPVVGVAPLLGTAVATLFYNWLPFDLPYLYLAAFAIALPFIFKLTKSWSWDSYVGELSYPVYTCHILLLMVIQTMKIPFSESLGTTLCLASIGFSIFLNHLLAKRIEVIRQRRVASALSNAPKVNVAEPAVRPVETAASLVSEEVPG